MKRTALPIVVVLVAGALVALLAYGLSSTGTSHSLDAQVAKGARPPAPSRALPVLGGHGTKSLADYRGKVVLLNFWAHWCPPCRAEAGLLERTQKHIQGKGATVLGVAYDDTVPDALSFNRRHGITYPNLRDVGTKLAQAYGTTKLPESFVIDRHGRIAAISRGELSQKWLDQHLYPLLNR